MGESSKSVRQFSELEWSILKGRIIDIGAGPDPVTPGALGFDKQQGDANKITQFQPGSFDCVYSSHCLEHMFDPRTTISNWWDLVKPSGHLFFIVPDEDLYEQGQFPSVFNNDHKHTFTISKKKSWSSSSINVIDLCQSLADAEIVKLHLNDSGYDRRIGGHGPKKKSKAIELARKLYRSLRKRHLIPRLIFVERWFSRTIGWDQLYGNVLAQIEVILRKKA